MKRLIHIQVIGFVLLLTAIPAWAQEASTLLVISNRDGHVFLDGVDKGEARAASAFRMIASAGEHYVEVQVTDQGNAFTKGEIVHLDSGAQKIIRIDFEQATAVAEVGEIAVARLNFDLPGLMDVIAWKSDNEGLEYPYPAYYLAFEKGDEIIIDAYTTNQKGTNILEVTTYPDNVLKYSNKGFVELRELRIAVPERSIYKFTFSTNHTFARNCFAMIRRKPASAETAGFNTAVSLKKLLTPVTLHEAQNFFINSGSNATFRGGKSRITIPIQLPPNTIEWFYRFSASREASDIEDVKNSFGLFVEISTLLLDLSGAGAAIGGLAVEKLTQPPGANYCDVYLLHPANRDLFEAKQSFQFLTDGSRENFSSGNVKVTCCNGGIFYLGLMNPDPTYGVNAFLEVVAITAEERFVMSEEY